MEAEERDFQVEVVGSCVVITMDLGENRINNNFIRAMNKALDEVERYWVILLVSTSS